MIPDAAVEAAFESLFAADAGMKEFKRATWLPTINKILEAAAPHMLAAAWLEGRNSQPDRFAANPYWKESVK